MLIKKIKVKIISYVRTIVDSTTKAITSPNNTKTYRGKKKWKQLKKESQATINNTCTLNTNTIVYCELTWNNCDISTALRIFAIELECDENNDNKWKY